MALVLANATCVTPFRTAPDRTVVVRDGVINRLTGPDYEPSPADDVRDLDGDYLLPGLIDLHVHGAVGADFYDEDLPVREMVDFAHRHGITGLLATVHPRPLPEMTAALERLAGLCGDERAQGTLVGIHCEGPFLNPEMAGGAPARWCCRPSRDAWERLRDAAGGRMKVLTISPELQGAATVTRDAARAGVAVSMGHTAADYHTVERAMDEGVSLVTHVFNAMEPLKTREPNALLAALLEPGLRLQLNAEGVHVHPLVMRMLYRLKGAEGLILTSDLHPAAGLEPGTYTWEGVEMATDGRVVRFPDGTMVGSARPLDHSLRTVVREVGVPLPEAVRMATVNPARAVGLGDRKGRIAPGRDADLAVLDGELRVRMTVAGGRVVYEAGTPA